MNLNRLSFTLKVDQNGRNFEKIWGYEVNEGYFRWPISKRLVKKKVQCDQCLNEFDFGDFEHFRRIV